jgi:hypothetical protein
LIVAPDLKHPISEVLLSDIESLLTQFFIYFQIFPIAFISRMFLAIQALQHSDVELTALEA